MDGQIQQVLSYMGVGCYTDAYILGPKAELYLISLFGTHTRVNAVKALILDGDAVYVQDLESIGWKERRQVQRSKLSSGIGSNVLIPLKTLNRKLAPEVSHSLIYAFPVLEPESKYEAGCKIIFGSPAEVRRKFFSAVQNHYSTPLLPEWTDWLWEEMAVEPLAVLGFEEAYRVTFLDEGFLEQRLFEYGSPIYRAEPN